MASGDTKTEQMLNVLGNGGSGDEFRGCCNTKTQSYILDAIDRINALDPSGGTNAKTEFVSENQLEISGKTEQGIDATPWQFSYIVDAETGDVVPTLSDGSTTWDLSVGGGGGGSVYSTKTTSNSATGGAVYIGDKNANQETVDDPTTTDNHYKYFWALPSSTTAIPGDNSVNILGKTYSGRGGLVTIGSDSQAESGGIAIGRNALCAGNSVAIGTNANSEEGSGFNNYNSYVAIGHNARSRSYSASMGYEAKALDDSSVAVGCRAECWQTGSIALGRGSYPSRAGELHIGSDSTAYGFGSTNYRVIGGVHDGQELHDAATVAQGNTLSTSAPTTSTVGVLGQLYTDTTNMHTYQLGSIDETDPSNPVYNWVQRW